VLPIKPPGPEFITTHEKKYINMQNWLIFTDLDSTLLDHKNYDFSQALPALEKIRRLQIPLIINSSKTYAEISAIRKDLHVNDAFAVENGAVVFFPAGLFSGYEQPENQVLLGRPLTEILHIIHPLRAQYRFAFKGFTDYSVAEVMMETGLTENQAVRAKQRLATEPVKWLDSQEKFVLFEQLLKAQGLQILKGGRFLHVMGQNDKASAMAWLLNKYQMEQQNKLQTIALGDSQNDQKMLAQADYAGIIRKQDGSYLPVRKPQNRLIRSPHPAPLGWQEVMDQLFIRLQTGHANE
jgi:mannosyl-3-phosphoglycerate phosphatase